MSKSKIVSIILVFTCLLGAFAGCNGGGSQSSSSSSGGGSAQEFTPRTYQSNGVDLADYGIVISQSASKAIEYAAEILQTRIAQASGVTVPVITDAQSEGENEIIIGKTTRSECAQINYESLGEESYKVTVSGTDLIIAGNERGALYGVYAFLEALGYRFYTVDAENIPGASEVFVPEEITLEWQPAFEYREVMYYSTWNADWAVSQKINSDFQRGDLKSKAKYGGYAGYIGGSKWMVHTFQYLLPKTTYYAGHPEYYSYVGESRIPEQPCLSSEGAYEAILQNVLAKIAAEPDGKMISVSENDNTNYCRCEECLNSYEQYGVSGTFFRFLNRLAGDVAEVYPDVLIDTLSYGMSKEVPEGVTIADNIVVRVCPTTCNLHTDPAQCEVLAGDIERIKEWKKICSKVYVYFYPINWGNLYSALPNYAEMRNYVKIFAENGVAGVYAEGYSKTDPEFSELKAYLMAKLLANPEMSESEYNYHYNDFISAYYGDAAEYIVEYHRYTKQMIAKLLDSEDEHVAKWFSVEENFLFDYDYATGEYDLTDINYINGLWQNAVDSSYGKTLDRVKKSRIHWMYIELYNTMDERMLTADETEREDLIERNRELYNDIITYGTVRRFDNSYEIGKVSEFTLSPKSGRWFK